MNRAFLQICVLVALSLPQAVAQTPGKNLIDRKAPIPVPAAFQTRLTAASRIAAVDRIVPGQGKAVEQFMKMAVPHIIKKAAPDGSFGIPRALPTALSVLAILGAGDAAGETGRSCAAKAVDWLLETQAKYSGSLAMVDTAEPVTIPNGISIGYTISHITNHPDLGADAKRFWYAYYHPVIHAVGTEALTEYYALYGEERARAGAEKAISIILKAQQPNGGWNEHFDPSGPVNFWTTAYQVRALCTAQNAGLGTPQIKSAIEAAAKYAKMGWDSNRGYLIDTRSESFANSLFILASSGTGGLPARSHIQHAMEREESGGNRGLFSVAPPLDDRLSMSLPALLSCRAGLARDRYMPLASLALKRADLGAGEFTLDPKYNGGHLSSALGEKGISQYALITRALQTPYLYTSKVF